MLFKYVFKKWVTFFRKKKSTFHMRICWNCAAIESCKLCVWWELMIWVIWTHEEEEFRGNYVVLLRRSYVQLGCKKRLALLSVSYVTSLHFSWFQSHCATKASTVSIGTVGSFTKVLWQDNGLSFFFRHFFSQPSRDSHLNITSNVVIKSVWIPFKRL